MVSSGFRIANLLAILAVAACTAERPYLELAGGGFVFNYRNAEVTYGVVLAPRKDPPAGAIIEASFEDPAGGEPIVITRPARGGGRIDFETPGLHGVEKDRPYHVVVVLRSAEGEELQRLEKDIVSELDQSVLPERPLTVGPGYQRNIDGSTSPFPESVSRPAAPPSRGDP
jgi:hypothetical protein